MTEKFLVTCVSNPVWDVATQSYVGQDKDGQLIDFGTRYKDGEATPVGIVAFDDGTFDSVPLPMITKKTM